MARGVSLPADWIQRLTERLRFSGESVASVAREVGIVPRVLLRRVKRAGLKRKKRGAGTWLVFRARCPCGLEIVTSQLGVGADSAWRSWHRRARLHARDTHARKGRAALAWADDLWIEMGQREMSDRDPEDGDG